MTMDNNKQDIGVISETLVVPCQGGYEKYGPLKRIYGLGINRKKIKGATWKMVIVCLCLHVCV